MLSSKSRCGKHFHVGIDVYEILFGVHVKIVQSPGNFILMIGNLHPVIDNSAGMSHPLSANHKLIFRIFPERIPDSSVPPGKTASCLNSFQQPFFLLLRYFGHRDNLNDKIKGLHQFLVGIRIQFIGNNYLRTFSSEPRHEDVDGLPGFMAIPAPINIQNFLAF